MNKILVLLISFIVVGCGYTTRGFVYDGNTLIIEPAVSKIDITSESRRYSNYTSFPILIENRLTNELVNRFNIDGGLKVVNTDPKALKLSCEVYEYNKATLRYTDSDDVKEQRLRLYVRMKLVDSEGEDLKVKTIIGETEYFLSGANSKSETAAQIDLIEDTARRILEAVVEEW